MIKRIYASFNARDIDAVLAVLSDDGPTAWMAATFHGRQAVRDYWTRQWAVISPHVEPVTFEETPDGAIAVEVIQSVFDLDGRPLEGQSHGLKDKTVTHIFRMEGDKIVRFDIRDAH
ncbi:nuclear transport factor 2 family protein [Rhizobium sp. BT-175]|uniref:nuclear transport factor 2 family protein n=1 Tax=Rhizobium sp. BT-175 TaxID=2986929 RepID=UPI0022364843|nr:nuclear transport factor 2 family protein [Rhizobium sp. BT-175]MCV9944463.1 nuclear transport factor 2 family protein [Rhizobium sp. BT-175]